MPPKHPSGLNPFATTPAKPKALSTKESNNSDLAHLAHIDSKLSRGRLTEETMKKANITAKTSGSRWYVEYYITDESGVRTRKRDYGYINKEKDLAKRMQLIQELQQQIYYRITNTNTTISQVVNGNGITVYQATIEAIRQKENYLTRNAYKSVEKNLKPWLQYLIEVKLASVNPNEIRKIHVLGFRTWRLQQKISNRTVNNNMDEIKTIFNMLLDQEIMIYKNPCKGIVELPSRSETHVAYTNQEAQNIFNTLKISNPKLLLYIKFVSFVFTRCNETRLIQIKDIDIEGKKLTLPARNAKTGQRKQKLIPAILLKELKKLKLEQYPRQYYLFSSNNLPGEAPVDYNYYSRLFLPLKKKFGLSRLHTIYGFRHTFICQLSTSGYSDDEIMKLTGHTTLAAFQQYKRSILQLPAKDLSDGFQIKL